MLYRFGVTLTILSFLGGCAIGQGQINPFPTVVNQSNSAKILIKRDSALMGSAQTITFTINGIGIYKLRSGDQFQFSVDPGEYLFGVACGGGWQVTGNVSEIAQDISPREKYIFRVISDMNRGCRIERSSFR